MSKLWRWQLVAALLTVGTACSWGTQGDAAAALKDPRGYFQHHQLEFEKILEMVQSGELRRPAGPDAYYGPALPAPVKHLLATGRVSILPDGDFFIPSWTGIPDDAGGYWHSASAPEGRDMYGMYCSEPIELGAGWWACGL